MSTDGSAPVENVNQTDSYWFGTFYTAEAADGWPVDSEDILPELIARVTDASGNVWTSGVFLTKG